MYSRKESHQAIAHISVKSEHAPVLIWIIQIISYLTQTTD